MPYKTSDTPLAAFLITQGFAPVEIDYSNPPRFLVSFGNGDDTKIRELANQYMSGTARVDPATFHRVTRRLMRLLHDSKQWSLED